MLHPLVLRHTFSDRDLNTVLRDYRKKINEIMGYFLKSDKGVLKIYDSDESNLLSLIWDENDSNDRDFNLKVNKGDRTIDLSADITVESTSTLNQDYTTDAGVIFAGITINGDSNLDGAVIINESNANKDFRVEGDGATYTHLLFTDASANKVGINEDAPKALLHVRLAESSDYAGVHPTTAFILENSGNCYLQFQSTTGGTAGLIFADDDYNPPAGVIRYDFANEQIEFGIGTNELVWFGTTGAVFQQNQLEINSIASAYFTANSHNADAYFALEEDEGIKWSMGFDYTDSLKFQISQGVPGTNVRFTIAPGGNVLIGGTFDCGTITVANGSSINLQEDITFTGATGVNQLKMPDNLLDALSIQEGSNKYMTFETVDDEEDIFFYKSVDILHTSTHADDHALEIDADAAGHGDVKAIEINYITGDISTGEDEGILLLNIDRTLATGGDIFALEVLATDQVTGSTGIYGLKIGPEIGPIHQDSGSFIDPTLATNDTPRTHVANMVDGVLATTTSIFLIEDDYIIISADDAFQDMELVFLTPASKNIRPTFHYSISGIDTFAEFTPVDGTDGCRHTGVISWDADDVTGGGAHVADSTTGKFAIKMIRTKAGSMTTPVLGYAKTAKTVEYVWDEDGDVNIRNLSVAGTLGSGAFTMTQNSDTVTITHDGTHAYFKTTDGILTFMTDEGTNKNTVLGVQGKGTGAGILRVYDENNAEWIQFQASNQAGYLKVDGASPSVLNFQFEKSQSIKCWAGIPSGNPYFYFYGKGTAAVEWLRVRVESDNDALIEAEHDLNIIAGGGDIFFGNENIGVNQASFGTNSVGVLAQGNGTAPTTSPTDCFQMYSADQVAGNACAHFRTEGGTIIKLYQQVLVADPAGQANDLDSEARTAIDSILDILENNGLMANA